MTPLVEISKGNAFQKRFYAMSGASLEQIHKEIGGTLVERSLTRILDQKEKML